VISDAASVLAHTVCIGWSSLKYNLFLTLFEEKIQLSRGTATMKRLCLKRTFISALKLALCWHTMALLTLHLTWLECASRHFGWKMSVRCVHV